MNQTPVHLLAPHKSAVIAAARELLRASGAGGVAFEIPGTVPPCVIVLGAVDEIGKLVDQPAREPMLGGRRKADVRPSEPLNWNEPEPGQLRRWAALITSANHGILAEQGYKFPQSPEKYERIEVVEVLPGGAQQAEAEPVAIPAHLLEFVEAVAGPTYTYVDRETDQTCCNGCNRAERYVGLTEPPVLEHAEDCIVLRARAILAAPVSERAEDARDGWSKEPPTEQGEYWHWNGEDDIAPYIYHIMWSGTAKKCFVSIGQYGITEASFCDEFGGWWKKIPQPAIPGDAAMAATNATKEGQQ